MTAIIDRLYKNRRRCNYYVIIRGLTALLGKDACRTYDTKKIQHLNEVIAKRNKGWKQRLRDWLDWF